MELSSQSGDLEPPYNQIVSDQSGSQLLSYMQRNGNSSEVDMLVFSPLLPSTFIFPNLATKTHRELGSRPKCRTKCCTILPCYTNLLSDKIRGIFDQMTRFLLDFSSWVPIVAYRITRVTKRGENIWGENETSTMDVVCVCDCVSYHWPGR